MALALSDYTTRIANELKLLAVPTAARNDLIKDGLTALMTYIRNLCRISATMAVTTSTTEYDIPATIDIVESVKDDDGDNEVYSVNTLSRKITLQDTPGEAANYTVYGTPYNVRTNAATIIAALPESYGEALWAYIVAACHDCVESDRWESKFKKAELQAHKLLMYLNSTAGYLERTIAIRDMRGYRIGITGAADGIDYDITDLAATEEYDPTA